ncbi:MAG TPA: FimV/HubP family polar landmark protein, partial [Gammaproteobacteria bacterium]|nr:FimV/HubP family polar landmark protein [Gammaproteobacteria bacterium]
MPTSAQPGRLRSPSRVRGIQPGKVGYAAVLVGFLAVSPAAVALGLGSLKVQSKLGNPLHAEAPIHISGGESGSDLKASLASKADYEMVGKSPSPLVRQLKVRMTGGDSPHIVLTSSSPLQEPLFEVMVRVGDGDNQVLKMYTVALDPPRVAPPSSSGSSRSAQADHAGSREGQAHKASAGSSTTHAPPRIGPAVARPKVAVTKGWSKRDRYGPVREGDTLATIVQRVRQDSSVPMESAVVAVWKANPSAFIGGNMNLLRRGAVLDM